MDRRAQNIFQIPTRREPDHFSLLTVELEAIGSHPRSGFIYALRHSDDVEI